jgi:hypothetical protein
MTREQILRACPRASEAFIKLNLEKCEIPMFTLKMKSPKKPVRMNKTEEYFESYLKALYPNHKVLFACYTIKLGDDVRYTPDFCAMHISARDVDFFEVKNENRLFKKELVKVRIAATMFPWHNFYIAIKQGTGFEIEKINPR